MLDVRIVVRFITAGLDFKVMFLHGLDLFWNKVFEFLPRAEPGWTSLGKILVGRLLKGRHQRVDRFFSHSLTESFDFCGIKKLGLQ